jgi:hypothetical protein
LNNGIDANYKNGASGVCLAVHRLKESSMRRLRVVVLLAAVAACAVGAASALAALPEFGGTVPNSFTGASTTPSFESAGGVLKVKCTQSEAKGTITNTKSGTFDELYLGCECFISGLKVGVGTGLTDTVSGSILATGTTILGFVLGTLEDVQVLNLTPFHFECGTGGTLVNVRGCLVARSTLAKSLKRTLTFAGSAGKQELTDYTSDAGAMIACKVEGSTNGGAFAELNMVQKTELTYAKEIEVKD